MSAAVAVSTLSTGTVVTTTANSTSAGLDDGEASAATLAVTVAVSAVTGTTPSLAIEVQWSNDNVTFVSAETPDTFTAVTVATSKCKQFGALKGRYFRLTYTATGTTPSFTITATALIN